MPFIGSVSGSIGSFASKRAFTIPNNPTNVTATATGTSQEITVSWTAPSAPSGAPITNYYIDYSTSSTFASGVTTVNTGSINTSKTITDSGWTNGTTLYFRVRAENGYGQSTNSSSANDYPYAVPSFGTQAGSSAATPPGGSSSTSVSSVGTTTATLGYSLYSNDPGKNTALFDSYERISGTSVTPSGNSLTGLAKATNHQWRVVVKNKYSTQSLITKITPNGSSCTVGVEYGDSISYGNNATVSSGNSSIGSGNSEVSTTWDLGSSTAATIYYRITVTYRNSSTTTKTGSITRTVSTYSGTTYSSATVVFETMDTYTCTSFGYPSGMTVKRMSYHNNITSISVSMVSGGGGGSGGNGGYGTGGGGGGQVWSVTGYESTGSMSFTAPASGGFAGGYGGTTSWKYWSYPTPSLTTVTPAGGTPGVNGNGGDSGSGNSGSKNGTYPFFGGGGGGQGGASNSTDGGAADANSWGGGGGGYGDGGYGVVNGARTYGVGAGGNGAGGAVTDASGVFGYWTITYTGPAATSGYTASPAQTY